MSDKGICKVSYGVGRFPKRKQIALYRANNATVEALAWFDDESKAREFMQFVDRLAHISTQGVEPDNEWHGWAEVFR